MRFHISSLQDKQRGMFSTFSGDVKNASSFFPMDSNSLVFSFQHLPSRQIVQQRVWNDKAVFEGPVSWLVHWLTHLTSPKGGLVVKINQTVDVRAPGWLS